MFEHLYQLHINTVEQPVQKFGRGQKNCGGKNAWFYANNTILFRTPPLKEQNNYMFQKFGGHGSLGPPGYAYASMPFLVKFLIKQSFD